MLYFLSSLHVLKTIQMLFPTSSPKRNQVGFITIAIKPEDANLLWRQNHLVASNYRGIQCHLRSFLGKINNG